MAMDETEEGRDPATVLARAPAAVREAVATGDVVALQRALGELPPEEAQRVLAQLRDAGIIGVQRDPKLEQILREWEPILQSIAGVAGGDERRREEIERLLPQLEQDGWHIEDAVRRIRRGERDARVLTNGLDRQDSALVERLLEILHESSEQREAEADSIEPAEGKPVVGWPRSTTALSDRDQSDLEVDPATVLASLPPPIRETLMEENMPAFLEALRQLPLEEAAGVVQQLQDVGILGVQSPPAEKRLLQEFGPFLEGLAAVASGEASAKQRAELEKSLEELAGRGWRIDGPVRRIWAGERDAPALTAGLDEQDSLLVQRLLELMAE